MVGKLTGLLEPRAGGEPLRGTPGRSELAGLAYHLVYEFMRDLLWYGVQILLWVVALMSGIFSLGRELLLIYRGKKTQPRTLFWNCTIIAFVISSTALWGLGF
jgi:hypothetical protein